MAKVDIKEFHKELPARFEKKIHDISKLDFLRKELHLSDAETEYLLFRYRKGTIQIASEVLNTLTCNSIGLYTEILGITKKQFQQITRIQIVSRLRKSAKTIRSAVFLFRQKIQRFTRAFWNQKIRFQFFCMARQDPEKQNTQSPSLKAQEKKQSFLKTKVKLCRVMMPSTA